MQPFVGMAPARPSLDDRGAVAANVAIVPIVLLLFFLVVQAALWYYGSIVVSSAAQHGLDAGRVVEGGPQDGETVVEQFIGQVGGLEGYEVEVTASEEEVEVAVTAQVVSVVPGLPTPTVRERLTAPRERLVVE